MDSGARCLCRAIAGAPADAPGSPSPHPGTRGAGRGGRAHSRGRDRRTLDPPRARGAPRRGGAVLAARAGTRARFRGRGRVDRQRRWIQATPRIVAAGKLLAQRTVRSRRVREHARGSESAGDGGVDADAPGRAGPAMVATARILGCLPERIVAARGVGHRQPRSPTRGPCRAGGAGLAAWLRLPGRLRGHLGKRRRARC